MQNEEQMEIDDFSIQMENKIEILKGHEIDFSSATFVLNDEDHTIGNALRFMLMKNPSVEFCGYTNPHPSESKIHLRIQMYDGKSTILALRQALQNLEFLFQSINDSYQKDLEKNDFEQFKDVGLTEEEKKQLIEKASNV